MEKKEDRIRRNNETNINKESQKKRCIDTKERPLKTNTDEEALTNGM